MSAERFSELFDFRPELYLNIGVERECFLTRNGRIVPIAPEVIPGIGHEAVGYELSACQLEYRVGPIKLYEVKAEIEKMEDCIREAGERFSFKHSHIEVAPDDIPLDVYPDPAGRYQRIADGMPREVLLAACRVTGTHIHIGMPSHEVAIETYNRAISHWQRLAELGDSSGGQRLDLYRVVAGDPTPPRYDSWDHFYQAACHRGFADNPRNCWDIIRVSKHGTIEFRMFGVTCDIDQIVAWARECYGICLPSYT